MAQFRGTIRGARGEASRLGGKESGLRVTANGWHGGVEVRAYHEDGEDHFDVYATDGSGYGGGAGFLGTVDANGNWIPKEVS